MKEFTIQIDDQTYTTDGCWIGVAMLKALRTHIQVLHKKKVMVQDNINIHISYSKHPTQITAEEGQTQMEVHVASNLSTEDNEFINEVCK